MELSEYEFDYRATAALGFAVDVLRMIIKDGTAMELQKAALTLARIIEMVPEFRRCAETPREQPGG